MVEHGEGGLAPSWWAPEPPGYRDEHGGFTPSRGPGFTTDMGGFEPYRPGYRDEHGGFEPYRPGYKDEQGGVHQVNAGPYNSPLYGPGYVSTDGIFTPQYGPGEQPRTNTYGPAPQYETRPSVPLFDRTKFESEVSASELPSLSELSEGDIRETLRIGGKTVHELQRMIEDEGMSFSYHVSYSSPNYDFTTQFPKNINIVGLRARDFGFDESTYLGCIYTRAKKRGLSLCPPEVGPWMRLQYKGPPKGSLVMIAMEPYTDRNGWQVIFKLGCTEDGVFYMDEMAIESPDLAFIAKIRPDRQLVFCTQ